jgi:hypothetical protein
LALAARQVRRRTKAVRPMRRPRLPSPDRLCS